MQKLIALFKRRRDVEIEAFHEYWRTRHAELATRLPGIRRYVQNHTLRSIYAKREPVYDAVAEAWFEDGALAAIGNSAAYRDVREDEPKFIDVKTLTSILVEDHAIIDGEGPVDGVKNVAFLTRRSDLSPEEFRRYWRETHGPIAARIPGSRRYVQSSTTAESYLAPQPPAFDGVAFAWFDDTDAMRRAAPSEEYARTRADEANFMSTGRVPFVIARAVPILT